MLTEHPPESKLTFLLSFYSRPGAEGGVSALFGLFAGARLLPAIVTQWNGCSNISVLECLAFDDVRFSVFACTGLLSTGEISAFLRRGDRPDGLYQRLRSKYSTTTTRHSQRLIQQPSQDDSPRGERSIQLQCKRVQLSRGLDRDKTSSFGSSKFPLLQLKCALVFSAASQIPKRAAFLPRLKPRK